MIHSHRPDRSRSRRLFLKDLGRTSLGLVVVGAGLAGCDTGGDPVISQPSARSTTAPAGSSSGTSSTAPPSIARVDLGFVAAYVVARGGQAAVIDTGTEGSEGDILAVLEQMQLGWSDVSDVILTHSHGDHDGSLPAVAEAAPDASLWGGEADLPGITAPRQVTGVVEGDEVFGLQVIDTPGHTLGHISLLDGTTLFTGDAVVGDGNGGLGGSPPDFTADMDQAIQSVLKLSELEVTQVNVFHGFPVEAGQADLQALAQSLQG